MDEVLKFALLGIGAGAIYTLIAQGLVLIYRGSGIINFAQGAFAMFGAVLNYMLFRNQLGLGNGVSIVLAVAVVSAIGALVYLAIMHQLREASSLTRTIATLGVLLLLQSGVTIAFVGENTFYPTVSPLPQSIVHLFGDPFYSIGADRLWLFGIAVVTTVVLWAVSRFTLIGLATSAAAENEESASALGWSPDLIGALNWAVGSAFAAIAGILIAPIAAGVNFGAATSIDTLTFLVVTALAAALVGEFSSFPLTFAAGMGIGIAESLIGRYQGGWANDLGVTLPDLTKTLPFLVIIAVLLIRGKGLPLRGYIFDRLPSLGSGKVSWPTLAVAVAFLVFMTSLLQEDWIGAITASVTVAVVMLSLVVLTGYTGQISLAQYALAGLGAWAAGRLVDAQGWPFELAIVAGVLTAVAVGLVFALPALRTRGVTLAIVTLGLGTVVYGVVLVNSDYTGGFDGTVVGETDHPLRFFGLNIDFVQHPQRYALFVVVGLVVCALMVANVRKSRSGRRLIAVRTNERAAAALGISVFGAKMYAFALGAGIAGFGGILLAFKDRRLQFDQFTPFASIQLVIFAVIGGIGWVVGPLFGAGFAPGGLNTLFGSKVFSSVVSDVGNWVIALAGIGLFAVILFNPDGIAAEFNRQWKKRAARTGRAAKTPVRDPLPPVRRERVRPATLEVTGLSVRFGGVVALDDVDVRVEPGRVVGLIGPNGAGKTTLIDGVTGFVRPAAGTVLLDGKSITRLPVHQRVRAGLSRSFQSLELFEDLTVLENLRSASDERDGRAYLSNLALPDRRPLSGTAVAAIHEFGLEDDLDRKPTELSFGRRRLLAIARAVAVQPSVLLLDEPAAGLDDRESTELAELVRRLADDWGLGILVIEHDMSFVMGICDQVVVLDFGRTIAVGTPAEIQRHPEVIRAYLGEDSEVQAIGEPPAATSGTAPERAG